LTEAPTGAGSAAQDARPGSAGAGLPPVPFHNKIFLCDIIGYSQREPLEQQKCHALIVDLAHKTLERVEARLDRDVIALPTGDGVAFNYKTDAPDIHVRTALEMLRMLDEHNRGAGPRVELRIGLNTHVDAIVTDVNGRENIVGEGINEAQRVMDLGGHAQVLLHRATYVDLRNYQQYQGRLRDLGDYLVKHDRVVPIVQYVDLECQFLNNMAPLKRAPAPKAAVDLAAIRRQRVKEKLLRIELKGAERGGLDEVRDYVAEFLDEHGGFQHQKIAVEWIAGEMLDNAFRHGWLAPEDQVALTLDLTKKGMLISTDQPAGPGFNLEAILSDEQYQWHFLALMSRRGFKLSSLKQGGRLGIACELPLDARVWTFAREMEEHQQAEKAPAPEPSRGEGASERLHGGVGLDIRHHGDVTVIEVQSQPHPEDLDVLVRRITKFCEGGHRKFILNLRGVERLSSTDIAALVNINDTCKEHGAQLVLCQLQPKITYVLEITNIRSFFEVADSFSSAVALLGGGHDVIGDEAR